MKYLIKKTYFVVTLLMVSSISYTYGYEGTGSECIESGNNLFCEPVCCDSNGKGFISADLLYWRAFEDGLEVCLPSEVTNTVTSAGEVTSKSIGKTRNPHFQWDPGFRIGAGYGLDCYNWDLEIFWSHLHSHTKSHGSRWNLNFDVIDLITSYDYDANCYFKITPFLGLRTAFIDQKLHQGERSSNFSSARQNFSGLGPLIGLTAEWEIGCGFNVYASISGSWLYGNFDVKLIDSERTSDTFAFCRQSKHLDTNLGAYDATLGIRWYECFCGNRIMFQLGFEHHRYFDYNRLGNHYGDLSFDGINFGVGFEF